MDNIENTVVNIFNASTNTLYVVSVGNISNLVIKQEITKVLSNPHLTLTGGLIKVIL